MKAKEGELQISIAPEQIGVADLLVSDRPNRQHRQQRDEHRDGLAFARRELWTLGLLAAPHDHLLRRKMFSAKQVDHEPDQHADPGGPEAPVPSHLLGKAPGDDRRHDHRDLDPEHVELEGVGAAVVTLGVEIADLGSDIALEAADAHQQTEQSQQETGVEGHQEVTQRHQAGAQRDGLRPPQHPVCKQAAQERRRIDPGRVEADCVCRQGKGRQVAVDGLHRCPIGGKSGHVPDVWREEQLLGHVEHQQALHAVVGEPLPRLGERQIEQADGVAEEGLLWRGRDACHG